MPTPRHTCPASRLHLPCWHTSAPVAAPQGTTDHFTLAALIEMFHVIQDVASTAWEAVRRGGDFVYGGVEYRVTR